MLLGTGTILVVALATAASIMCVAARRRAQRQPPTLKSSSRLTTPELHTPPAGAQFTLACPHCGFDGPIEDLSLVGQNVDCPLCEQSFIILEPLVLAAAD